MVARRLVLVTTVLLTAGSVASPDAPTRGVLQAQPAPNQPLQSTSAVLLGRVVDQETGDPIEEAVVTLTGRPAPATRGALPATGNLIELIAARTRASGSTERVATDREGRFVFRDLPASRYTLRGQAAGYLSAAVWPTGRSPGPATVDVSPGDTVVRVVVRLSKEAVITGVVLDEANEPVIHARVAAYRLNITGFSGATYDQAETAQTDDRGEYRMFGLSPGTYVVAVPQSHTTSLAAGADAMFQLLLSGRMPEGGLGSVSAGDSPMNPNAVRIGEFRLSSDNVQSPPVSADGPVRVYRTVYHPAALTRVDASPIALRSGELRSGIDFALTPVVSGRIAGTVTGSSGPASNVPIRLVAADGPLLPGSPDTVASGVTAADGRFTLLAVPPGRYRVIAEREALDLGDLPDEIASNPMIKMAMSMRAAGAGTPLYGEAVAAIGGGESLDVAITGREGVTVTGEVAFESGFPPEADLERIRLTLRSLGRGASSAAILRVDKQGRFAAKGVFPGRYLVSSPARAGGSPWLIREVTAGGRDVTTLPILVEDEVALRVLLTDRVGHVVGTVRREAASTAMPALAARRPLTAVVVPAEYTAWTDIEVAAEQVRIAVVDNDDTFRAGPLLAGEYLVAVVDESTLDLSAGLATLRAIAQQATRVSVSAGGANTVSVSVARGRR